MYIHPGVNRIPKFGIKYLYEYMLPRDISRFMAT